MNLRSALAAAVLVTAVPFAQGVSQPVGFYMEAPQGWHPVTTEGMVANLQAQIDPARMRQILTNMSSTTVLAVYQRYLPDEHRGLIPKIQVSVRRNPAKTFDAFRTAIIKSTDQLRALFPDMTLIQPVHEVSVGGRRAVTFTANYTVDMKIAGKLQVRSRTYAVPIDDSFFQLAFTDGSGEDCAAIFDALIGTVRFD